MKFGFGEPGKVGILSEIVNVRSNIFIITKPLNQMLNNILANLVRAYSLCTHKF